MYNNSAPWVDLQVEYKESLNSIREIKKRRVGTGLLEDEVDCQLAGEMMGEMSATIKELKDRSLYEFKTISLEDINNPAYGLTDRQRQVLQLRQQNSCKAISHILGIDQSTAYNIYKSALAKIEKIKLKEKRGQVIELSQQQNEILKLINLGYKNKEIALMLGISEGTLKVQKNRLKKRLTKP